MHQRKGEKHFAQIFINNKYILFYLFLIRDGMRGTRRNMRTKPVFKTRWPRMILILMKIIRKERRLIYTKENN